MAAEDINEPVNVLVSFRRSARDTGLAQPEIMHWRGRRYRIREMGMRYPTTKGQRMLHRFTFAVDGTTFELEFDAERLIWQLIRMHDGDPA
ncbi:MAG TPA: hypothetical protein VLI05_03115 [Candidatus Saccharimonadia bacterium]|nr:hypothetical protein [Candidatus Saccharimonadia bacterium]